MENEKQNLTELEIVRSEIKNQRKEIKELTAKLETGVDVTEEDIVRSDELLESISKLELKEKAFSRADQAKSFLSASTSESKKSKVFGTPAIRIAKKASEKDIDNACKAWMLRGHQTIHVQDAWKRSADLVDCDWEAHDFFCRAQSTDTEEEGAETLNGSVFKALVEAKQWQGTIMEYCDVIRDPIEKAHEAIHFAPTDDTATFGVYKTQNQALVNAPRTYDKVTINTHMVTTAMFPISIAYLMNPNFRVLDHVNKTIGNRLRKTILRDIVSGDGTGKPRGFLADVASSLVAYSNHITADDITDLWYAIDKDYRENAIFVAHDSTVQTLERSLINATSGMREWGPDLNSPPTDRLRGKPFVTDNNMPEMLPGTARKALAFGDFSHHKVRLIGPPTVKRDDSRLVDTLSVWFGGYQLVDSAYVNPGNDPIAIIGTGTLSGDSSYDPED